MNEKSYDRATWLVLEDDHTILILTWASTKEASLCGGTAGTLMNKDHLFHKMLFDGHSTCQPEKTAAFWELRLIQGKNSSKNNENT